MNTGTPEHRYTSKAGFSSTQVPLRSFPTRVPLKSPEVLKRVVWAAKSCVGCGVSGVLSMILRPRVFFVKFVGGRKSKVSRDTSERSIKTADHTILTCMTASWWEPGT